MNTTYNWGNHAPTQLELQLLEELKNNADPVTRLRTICNGKSYYEIKKQWICNQYQIAIEEYEDVFDARNDFDIRLNILKKDYERDTTLWLELKKASDGIYSLNL